MQLPMFKFITFSLFSILLIGYAQAVEPTKPIDPIVETFVGAKITLAFKAGASGTTKDKIMHIVKDGIIHVLVPHHAQRIYDEDADRKYEYKVTYELLDGWEHVNPDAAPANPLEDTYEVEKMPSADKIADAT